MGDVARLQRAAARVRVKPISIRPMVDSRRFERTQRIPNEGKRSLLRLDS